MDIKFTDKAKEHAEFFHERRKDNSAGGVARIDELMYVDTRLFITMGSKFLIVTEIKHVIGTAGSVEMDDALTLDIVTVLALSLDKSAGENPAIADTAVINSGYGEGGYGELGYGGESIL